MISCHRSPFPLTHPCPSFAPYPPLSLLCSLLFFCSIELCSRVAFEPLSKHLMCGTDCTAENVSVVWRFYRSLPPVTNGTFRYNIFPHEVHGSSIKYETVEVLADGQLYIRTVKEAAHQGDYSCAAYFSNNTMCGKTDHLTLMVTQLCKLSMLRFSMSTHVCPSILRFIVAYA